MSDIQRVAKNDPSVDSLPIAPENPPSNEPSPSIPHRVPGRGAGSRVTVGYFDREGVDQLRRTLTNISESRQEPTLNALSLETLSVPATGPFDLERTLRLIMKKCVVRFCDTAPVRYLAWVPQARQRRYSIARAWCLVQRSPCCRPGRRCELSANLWFVLQPQRHRGELSNDAPSSLT
jgi:hypothetical protein